MKVGRVPLWIMLAGATLLALVMQHAGVPPVHDPVPLVGPARASPPAAPPPSPTTEARAGPFALAAIVPVVDYERSADPTAVAPDANAIAYPMARPRTLAMVNLNTRVRATAPWAGNVSTFSSVRGVAPIVAWARDGRSLWATSRELTTPSGFARSEIKPIRIGSDGSVTPLPPLRSPAGALDAIQWVGHDGLALVQFGTGGSYYRPEHNDPTPELALVDAARGRVLDRLPFDTVPALRSRNRGLSPRSAIGWASAITMPKGQLAALIATHGTPERRTLIYWVQGTPPRVLPYPTPAEQFTRGALLPSGATYLLTRELKPIGDELICEIWSRSCPPAPPPQPRTGPLLELRDLASGQLRWSLTATAVRGWSGGVLEVSPDGRYALVSYPPNGGANEVAIVRLADGALVGTLPLPADQAGFTEGGRTIWVRAAGAIRLYRER